MQKKERMANLEVLRCVAMMMVVVLHYLGKGGLLPDLTAPLSVQDMVAWLLEAFCIVAVNVYMTVSYTHLIRSPRSRDGRQGQGNRSGTTHREDPFYFLC